MALWFPNPFLFERRLRELCGRHGIKLDCPSESGAIEWLMSEDNWEEIYPGPCLRVNNCWLVGVKTVFQPVKWLGGEKLVERHVWWLASETLDGDFDEILTPQTLLDGNHAIGELVKAMLASRIGMTLNNWDAEDSVTGHPWRTLP